MSQILRANIENISVVKFHKKEEEQEENKRSNRVWHQINKSHCL